MPPAVLRALGGALACLMLAVFPCLGGEEAPVAGRGVPAGGQFSPERARRVAETAAWLAGLERAAEALSGLDAVRLAGLDVLQLQALAACLGMVEVSVDSRPAAETLPGDEEDMMAVARLAAVDAGRVSRLLADVDGRERYEDVIVAVRALIPEALQLADTGCSLRALRVLPGAPASDAPPDEPIIARLNRLADHLEAYALYRGWLDRGQTEEGGSDRAAEGLAVLDKALALAPAALPLRLARAELLLRQDRFRAAAQALRDLPEIFPPSVMAPGAAASPESTARDRAELRLLARALEARALAQLRSGRPALAESDLDAALVLAPERASLWLGRGAARQMRERFGPMCDDYHQACVRGLCRGLAAARERGQCLDDEGDG